MFPLNMEKINRLIQYLIFFILSFDQVLVVLYAKCVVAMIAELLKIKSEFIYKLLLFYIIVKKPTSPHRPV